jgi:RNA polymerase sigma factor (sigma-70 family)
VEQLYREYGHSVLRRARSLLGSEGEAEEVLHEVFLKLLEDPAQLGRMQNPLAWLYGVTTYACFNRIRNKKTRARLVRARPPSDEAHDAGFEQRLTVERLLSSVSDETAAALVYHHMDQMTHAEIAQILGCSRRHVGHLLERATQKFAESEKRAVESSAPAQERQSS